MKIQILWLLNLQVFFCSATGNDCKREPKCGITRAHKMKAANCYDRQFKYFPKCLNTDVEVIDLSFNRIRKVTKADISKFRYLKYLYLGDNLLTHIEGDIFEDASGLMTLDLSLNAITKLPPAIFQLPSLKTLYLNQNLNINISEALEIAKPITSPLTQIYISETSDEENYSQFPDFGILPFLALLNITGNFYFSLSPHLIMGLCNLQRFVTDNVTIDFDEPCDCWNINYWLKYNNVIFTPFSCSVLPSQCTIDLSEEDIQLNTQCKDELKRINRNNLIINVCIGIGAAGGTILLLILLIYLWRRTRNRNHKVGNINQDSSFDDSSPLNTQEKSIPNVYSL